MCNVLLAPASPHSGRGGLDSNYGKPRRLGHSAPSRRQTTAIERSTLPPTRRNLSRRDLCSLRRFHRLRQSSSRGPSACERSGDNGPCHPLRPAASEGRVVGQVTATLAEFIPHRVQDSEGQGKAKSEYPAEIPHPPL